MSNHFNIGPADQSTPEPDQPLDQGTTSSKPSDTLMVNHLIHTGGEAPHDR